MDIEALQKIFHDMQSNYSAKYLLTTRVNQDCLENFFSRIRYYSGSPDSRPGPVEFKQRFRNLVLGSSADIVVNSAPVLFENEKDNSEILSVTLLKGLYEKSPTADPTPATLPSPTANAPSSSSATAPLSLSAGATSPVLDQKRQKIIQQANTDTEINEVDCSEEGLKYVAGFLAFKLKKKYPGLGTSANSPLSCLSCPWIETVSYGGLTKPTAIFLTQIQEFEETFKRLHGQGISREEGIIQKLKSELAARHPSVPDDILSLYSKTRTHIRIKFLKRGNAVADDTRSRKKVLDYLK